MSTGLVFPLVIVDLGDVKVLLHFWKGNYPPKLKHGTMKHLTTRILTYTWLQTLFIIVYVWVKGCFTEQCITLHIVIQEVWDVGHLPSLQSLHSATSSNRKCRSEVKEKGEENEYSSWVKNCHKNSKMKGSKRGWKRRGERKKKK